MSLALKVYDAFKDDHFKASILAEAFETLETKFLKLDDVATNSQVKITELTLRKDIEEVRLTLGKDIEEVRLTLGKDIEEVRLTLGKDIEKVKSSIIKWSFAFWTMQIAAVAGIIFAVIKIK